MGRDELMARNGSPELVPRNVLACVLHVSSSKKYFCLFTPSSSGKVKEGMKLNFTSNSPLRLLIYYFKF